MVVVEAKRTRAVRNRAFKFKPITSFLNFAEEQYRTSANLKYFLICIRFISELEDDQMGGETLKSDGIVEPANRCNGLAPLKTMRLSGVGF